MEKESEEDEVFHEHSPHEEDRELYANVNDDCRHNVTVIATTDMLIIVLVTLASVAYLVETLLTMPVDNALPFIAVTVTFLIFMLFQPLFDYFLLKSTKSHIIDKRDALKKAKWWLFYNAYLQGMTILLIVISLIHGNKALAGVGMGLFVLRIVFMAVVFRFEQNLLKPHLSALVAPESGPEEIHHHPLRHDSEISTDSSINSTDSLK